MIISTLLKPLALVSTLAVSSLGLLAQRYRKARLYFHLLVYTSTLGAVSVWGVVVSILASLAGQRLNINYYVARSFYHICSPLIQVKFDVEGEEYLQNLVTARGGKGQSAVLVGNHQSFFDILYLGRIFPKRAAIMAKKELKWSPLLGQYMTLSGAVFVDRKNRQGAFQALEKAGQEMKSSGISLWVFPEGTRSSSEENKLLGFKKGAFHLAVQAGVPVVPVVCENYWRIFDGRTRFETGRLRIRVLPPISTEGLTSDDVVALAESTREKMLKALKEISQPGPSQISSEKESQQADSEITNLQSDESDGNTTGVIHMDIGHEIPGTGNGTETAESDSLRLRQTISRGDGTEDEMDEDAVLMKRPKTD